MKNSNWTEEEDEIIKKLYLIVKNIKEIQILLPNRSYQAIINRANKFNLNRIVPYTKDENFFKIPNIQNAYIAGLLASDGCILLPEYKRGYQVCIGLDHKDKDILENIIKLTNSNIKIYERKIDEIMKSPNNKKEYERKTTFCTIKFNNAEKWVNDLQNTWNIIPNKSLILKPPKIQDVRQIIAFFQGYTEGDGSISLFKTNAIPYINITITILGTHDLLSWFKNIFETIIQKKLKPIYKKNKIYTFKMEGKEVLEIASFIRELETFKMQRKWNKVWFYIDFIQNFKNIKNKLNKMDLLKWSQEQYNFFTIKYNLEFKTILNPLQDNYWSTKFKEFQILPNINKNLFFKEFINYSSNFGVPYIVKKSIPFLRIQYDGEYNYLEWFKKCLNIFYNIPENKINFMPLYCTYQIAGHNAEQIYKLILNQGLISTMSTKWQKPEIISFINNNNLNNNDVEIVKNDAEQEEILVKL